MADATDALRRARARQAAAVTDLFLPADGRLREDDRATVVRLLAELVSMIERALRTRLAMVPEMPVALAALLADPAQAIAAPILERAGALRDPALVAVLVRRAGAARLAARLHRAADRACEVEPDVVSPVARLVGDGDAAVTQAAAGLLAVMAAARDAAGAPVAAGAELSAEGQHRLVWRIAAALREYLHRAGALPAAVLDSRLAAAAEAVLAGYDEASTPAGRALALAQALHAHGRLDDAFVVHALAAAEPVAAAAALAVRAGIGFGASWDMLCDPDPAQLLLLCRAAGLTATAAADLALRMGEGTADEALADALDAYGTLAPEQAAAALGLWRCDPAYRESIAVMIAESA